MADKQLKNKAILLKGKKYVQVVDRIDYFNETFDNGSIRTKLLSSPDKTHYVVIAKVIPDITTPERYFSGLSQAKLGDPGANKDAALENAETSAVGRALGMMGIGVIDSVASADEMTKAGVKNQKDNLTAYCEVHDVEMLQGISKKTGNPYWYHKNEAGDYCFGKGYKTK
jgi:hypothetical protein